MKDDILPGMVDTASRAIEQCFAQVPFCALELSNPEMQTDAGLGCLDIWGKLRVKEKEFTLFIEVKKSGQPRFARIAIDQFARYRSQFANSYPIFSAPFISKEAGDILTSENVGYVDFSGNCRICIDAIYIRQEGNSNRYTEKRDLRSLYSPKAERVLRVLMLDPKRTWKVGSLAVGSHVSLGQASNVKKLLEAREWLRHESEGFDLKEPEKLLTEWASTYRYARHRFTEFYSLSSTAEIEKQVAESASRLGALTGFSAAARFAPAVRYNKVTAFVRESSKSIAARLGFKPVTSGGNVTLIEPYDEGVFFGSREVQGVEIVSPVQTYLDLSSVAGRGEEAAEALLREVLRSSW